MDPVTSVAIAAAIRAAIDGAAGEAGKSAWQSLVASASRLLGRDDAKTLQDVEAQTAQGDPNAAIETASRTLARAADTDPEIADLIATWRADLDQAQRASTQVANIVTGHAQVTNLLQGNQITGDFHFGA